MATNRRVTQRDIAIRAGVTQATVSLALRNHPSVAPATRARIHELMGELGYRPDPYLSGLAAYRQQNREPTFHGTLAWLSNYPKKGEWRFWPAFVGYYEGAVARAAELGYQIEEHHLCEKGMSPERLEQVLFARNISGLLLPPQPAPYTSVEFPWERFSAVTFGYSLASPALHTVALHHFRTMENAFRRLVAKGYRRIGLALSTESDERSDTMLSSAFWSEQNSVPAKRRVPTLRASELTRNGLSAWVKRYKPDVVLAIRSEVYEWLVESGIRVPEDIGFAHLSVPEKQSIFAGVWENPRLTGAKAAELVVSMILHGERGVPEVPMCTLIEGSWVDGQTLVGGVYR